MTNKELTTEAYQLLDLSQRLQLVTDYLDVFNGLSATEQPLQVELMVTNGSLSNLIQNLQAICQQVKTVSDHLIPDEVPISKRGDQHESTD